MPVSLVAWSESVDQAALDGIDALDDETIRTNGDAVVIPPWATRLYGAYANGANLTAARLNAPSLQDVVRSRLEPVDVAAEPSFPLPFHWWGGSMAPDGGIVGARPFQLRPSELFEIETSEDAAGASRMNALAFLGNDLVPLSALPATEGVAGAGEYVQLRATNADTLNAFTWTSGQMTLDDAIQAGYYAILGGFTRSAGMLAARLNIPGMNQYRPGWIGADAVGDVGHPLFRMGGMGVLGVLDQDVGFSQDFLSVSGDTAQTTVLDTIFLGEERPKELLALFQVQE